MTGDESILLIEDDDDIREAIAAFLASEGYSVAEAKNGAEGLQLLRSGRQFCLVVLDLFMPVKNGWEFREEQLGDPSIADVPVVVVTADVGVRKKDAALRALEYMVKPIDLRKLLSTIAAHC